MVFESLRGVAPSWTVGGARKQNIGLGVGQALDPQEIHVIEGAYPKAPDINTEAFPVQRIRFQSGLREPPCLFRLALQRMLLSGLL